MSSKILRFKVSADLKKEKIIVTEIRRPDPQACLVLKADDMVELTEEQYLWLQNNESMERLQKTRVLQALGQPIDPVAEAARKKAEATQADADAKAAAAQKKIDDEAAAKALAAANAQK